MGGIIMSTSNKKVQWYETIKDDEENTVETEGVKRTVKGPKKSAKKEAMVLLGKYADDFAEWLVVINKEMDLEDRPDIALQAVRGVLHAIRDRMVPAEVFNLSAQLPVMVRGFYFEGYNLNDKPEKYNAEGFMDVIKNSFGGNEDIDPENAFKAVLNLLYDHVSKGEMNDIYGGLPKDIKELWKDNLNQEFA